jgi:hypothetical protein
VRFNQDAEGFPGHQRFHPRQKLGLAGGSAYTSNPLAVARPSCFIARPFLRFIPASFNVCLSPMDDSVGT